jgi:hypothetical protein
MAGDVRRSALADALGALGLSPLSVHGGAVPTVKRASYPKCRGSCHGQRQEEQEPAEKRAPERVANDVDAVQCRARRRRCGLRARRFGGCRCGRCDGGNAGGQSEAPSVGLEGACLQIGSRKRPWPDCARSIDPHLRTEHRNAGCENWSIRCRVDAYLIDAWRELMPVRVRREAEMIRAGVGRPQQGCG